MDLSSISVSSQVGSVAIYYEAFSCDQLGGIWNINLICTVSFFLLDFRDTNWAMKYVWHHHLLPQSLARYQLFIYRVSNVKEQVEEG